VNVTVDTNVLVRAITDDDPRQSRIAKAELAQAEIIALAVPALCELVWVLSRGYRVPLTEIAEAMRRLIGSANVVVDRPAVEAGLAVMDAGGDFADGIIAHEGRRLGADTFISFDRQAVRLFQAKGEAAQLLS
jgi:predicted nucleic-acid-binding protein